MTDILEAIIEESKQETLQSNFKKYAKWLLLIFIILLISVILYHWRESHNESIIFKESSDYIRIQNSISKVRDKMALQESLGKLEQLYKNGETVYSVVAGINLANINDAMGRSSEAAKIYEDISANDKVDGALRSFASLMKISSEIKSQKFTAEESLNTLDSKKNELFDISNKILKASLLLELKKFDAARAILEDVKMNSNENSMPIIDLLIGLTVKNEVH